MCKASIIIPAYNAARFLADTITSILKQSYPDFECIIIDDGSTDDTLIIAQSYTDPRIKVISLSNSGGPARPRNIGISSAKGEYIFMFDSDDIMHPDKLKLSIAALDKYTDSDILFTNFSSISENNDTIKADFLYEYQTLWSLMGGKPSVGDAIKIPSTKIYSALIKINFIGTSSVVIRKNSLLENDVFNETLKNSDDRLFWILFTKNHNAVYLHQVLHHYRIQENSISRQGFIRRGPSKIKALEIAYENCDEKSLRQIIKDQIASDYCSLAFAYMKQKHYEAQAECAVASLRSRPTLKAIKLFMQSYVYRAFNL